MRPYSLISNDLQASGWELASAWHLVTGTIKPARLAHARLRPKEPLAVGHRLV